ncbi:4Fe-4S binding protein, partial [bacterium]|nr:4Fe-4S binding protein [bacterium]
MIVIQDKPASPKKLKGRRKRIFRHDKKKGALNFDLVKTSYWRLGVQAGSTVLSLILGWQFIRFVEAAKTTSTGVLPNRPPGVEGYLPISGLMGAIDWIYQGTLNNIHPAATVLFLIFVLMAFLFRKAFCGWFCPVGFFSENLARLGRWIFGRNYRIVKWVDIPLQGLKYFLLGFFVVAILNMTPET